MTGTKEAEPKTITSLISGAVAGSVAKTVIAPLDRTKINFQVSDTKQYSFKNSMKFVAETYRNEGFLALYRGNSASLARVIPNAAINFAANERYKHLLQVDRNEKTPIKRFLAGSFAGCTSTLCTYPLDTARARLAVYSKDKYENLRAVFIKEYREKGLQTFYRGIFPTLLGSIMYSGTSFFTYGTLKLWYTEDGSSINPAIRFMFGGISGIIGQSVSYPLDIIRRRGQTGHIPVGQNVLVSLYKIWKNEGLIRGLYKGLSMNWIKGPLASGVSFTVYDLMKNLLGSPRK